jgi:thioredoxin reductase (NADPH)
MDAMRKQAHRFGAVSLYEMVGSIDHTKRPFEIRTERGNVHMADAVIIATGASAKLLGVPGEQEFMGFGVSACATCDGFFFRGMRVYVIGGGDTAMEEATYLTRFAERVTIVHRREEFRASTIMLERARTNPKIDFILNSTVAEFVGSTDDGPKRLTALVLENTQTGERQTVPADGAFVAIGHQPNTSIVAGFLTLDSSGYIVRPGTSTATNIEGIFACGDATDSIYRQAVTAAGSGCMAAIDAERWLEHQHHVGA